MMYQLSFVIITIHGNRNEVVQLKNISSTDYDLVHDQPCDYRTDKLDSSQDYAVPEPPLLTSKGGVRDAINLNQCPAYESATIAHANDGDEPREGLYDIVATA